MADKWQGRQERGGEWKESIQVHRSINSRNGNRLLPLSVRKRYPPSRTWRSGPRGELGRRDHVAGEGLLRGEMGLRGRGHPTPTPTPTPTARRGSLPACRPPHGLDGALQAAFTLWCVFQLDDADEAAAAVLRRGGRGRGRFAGHDGLVTVRRRGALLRVGSLAGAGRRAALLRGLRSRGLRGLRWLRRGGGGCWWCRVCARPICGAAALKTGLTWCGKFWKSMVPLTGVIP